MLDYWLEGARRLTDDIGTEEYNEGLSERRAQAVFRYLVNRGVAPERMEVVDYGESRPVASNETEAGRVQNRRVELHVKELKGAEKEPGRRERRPGSSSHLLRRPPREPATLPTNDLLGNATTTWSHLCPLRCRINHWRA